VPSRGQSCEGNRALKNRLVEAGQGHAALVMVGKEAIAWAEYGTRRIGWNVEHCSTTAAASTSRKTTTL
jgi:hypothetical protein